MAEVLGTFAQVELTNVYQTLYTVPSGETFVPKTIMFCNYSTSPVNVTVNFVANGETIANKNYVVKDKLLIPPETFFVNPDMYLQVGFTIQAKASVGGTCNCQLSGVKMT
jgi:hypothetical protein